MLLHTIGKTIINVASPPRDVDRVTIAYLVVVGENDKKFGKVFAVEENDNSLTATGPRILP